MMLHCEGVKELALKIGKEERASPEVLEAAAWLHDVSTYEKISAGMHCEVLSARSAERFLKEQGCPTDFVSKVVDAILSCGWEPVKKPTSIEQKSLVDADALHHWGPTGILIMVVFYASLGKSISEIVQALSQSMEGWTIYTKTGKRIFEERRKFVQTFLESLQKEINGLL
jgi:uncharacterized protein